MGILFLFRRQADYRGLSENERLMLVKKKEEIFKITAEILSIYDEGGSKTEIINKIVPRI